MMATTASKKRKSRGKNEVSQSSNNNTTSSNLSEPQDKRSKQVLKVIFIVLFLSIVYFHS